ALRPPKATRRTARAAAWRTAAPSLPIRAAVPRRARRAAASTRRVARAETRGPLLRKGARAPAVFPVEPPVAAVPARGGPPGRLAVRAACPRAARETAARRREATPARMAALPKEATPQSAVRATGSAACRPREAPMRVARDPRGALQNHLLLPPFHSSTAFSGDRKGVEHGT